MKTLSLHNPFAGLLVLGLKEYETRSWATKYRGPLAIHASAQIPKYAKDTIKMLQNSFTRFTSNPATMSMITKTGLIIGEVELVDCVPAESVEHGVDNWLERYVGDFTAGRFAWKCANPVIYKNPVSIKGKLQLWEWEKNLNE